MAGDARAVVVNRPEPVSAVGARIARLPFPLEQHAPLGHRLPVRLLAVDVGRDQTGCTQTDHNANGDDPAEAGAKPANNRRRTHPIPDVAVEVPMARPFHSWCEVGKRANRSHAYYICRVSGRNLFLQSFAIVVACGIMRTSVSSDRSSNLRPVLPVPFWNVPFLSAVLIVDRRRLHCKLNSLGERAAFRFWD